MSNRWAGLIGLVAVLLGIGAILFYHPAGKHDAYYVSRTIGTGVMFIAIGVVILAVTARSALRNRRRGGDK
jgi:hypothetical protein